MLTLIDNGEVYAPEPLGVQSVLLAGRTILKIGALERRALEALDVPYTIIDATDCLVTPGLIDPHQHLIGAGGEQGFASRMPEVMASEIALAGITTVVGCLGTDVVTRHLSSLLAKARQLETEGISAYLYTGGFPLPPQTLTGSVTEDLILIDKVIGLGELAIADERASEPSVEDLAKAVSQALVGGMVSGKAGVTHFHVGRGRKRLQVLNALLEQHEIPSRCVYPTHITNSEALMDEAIALANRGCFVDIDTVEDDLIKWLAYYHEHGGDLNQLTVSSDANTPGGNPAKLFRNFVEVVNESGLPLEQVLSLFTRNPARVLQLEGKGTLQAGKDADLVVLRRDGLNVVHVFGQGRHLVRDGSMVQGE